MRLPLVRRVPHRDGAATTHKDALLVHAVTDDGATAGASARPRPTPGYSGETLDGARLVIRDHLVPRAFAGARLRRTCAATTSPRPRSKPPASTRSCARAGESLAVVPRRARAPAVEAGVAIGITDDETELRRARRGVRAPPGYRRIKLQDRARRRRRDRRRGPRRGRRRGHARRRRQRLVRHSTTVGRARRARRVRRCSASNSRWHPTRSATTRRSPRRLHDTDRASTRSVTSAHVATDAIALGGLPHRQHQARPRRRSRRSASACTTCASTPRRPALIGGMLETGDRAGGERRTGRRFRGSPRRATSRASDRYFADDITEPCVLDDGQLPVPDRPRHRCDAAARRDRAATRSRARRCTPRRISCDHCGGAPDEHDRVLGRVGIEPHQDRIRERRLAGVLRARSRPLRHAGLRARPRHRGDRPRARCRSRSAGTCGCRVRARASSSSFTMRAPRVTPLRAPRSRPGRRSARLRPRGSTHGVRRRRQIGRAVHAAAETGRAAGARGRARSP